MIAREFATVAVMGILIYKPDWLVNIFDDQNVTDWYEELS